MSASDRGERIDGFDARLQRRRDGRTRHNRVRLSFDFPAIDGDDATAAVHRIAQRINHASEQPFADGNVDDARHPQLRHPPVDAPPDTPLLLDELLRACMARDAADRPGTVQIAEALEPMVAALPSRMVLSRRGIRGR